jgi:hypothetical protein
VDLLTRLPALTTAAGSGFGEHVRSFQVGLYPINKDQPMV